MSFLLPDEGITDMTDSQKYIKGKKMQVSISKKFDNIPPR